MRAEARLVLLAGLALSLAWPATAQAGRLIATGHDADEHCYKAGGPQCHYVKVAISYLRAGAPDPSKPVLVLDNGSLELQHAIDFAFGAGVVPMVVMDPSSPSFAGAPIDTATYSAIAVASDSSCGGCDLNKTGTADSDAINARKADIETFFNRGGGILALAGAAHGGASGADNTYYKFVPLPVGGAPVTKPFTLTPDGSALGLMDDTTNSDNSDINCCATHNSFTLPPSGSALKVAETDKSGLAETLFVQGAISGGGFVPPSSTPPPSTTSSGTPPAFGPGGVLSGLPSPKRCVSKRRFKIHVRRHRGITYSEAIIFVNRKQVGVDRIGGRPSAVVNLRNLPAGTFQVKITVITTTGAIISGTRTYHTCRKRLPFLGPPRL